MKPLLRENAIPLSCRIAIANIPSSTVDCMPIFIAKKLETGVPRQSLQHIDRGARAGEEEPRHEKIGNKNSQ